MELTKEVQCWKFIFLMLSVGSYSVPFTGQNETIAELFYDMIEELPLETVVADILTDSKLSEFKVDVAGQPLDTLQFEILFATFQNFFWIESPLGLLRINQTIDRDTTCFKKAKCTLQLDIQISSHQFIRLLRVSITVLDINDNAPSFHPSSLILNISESTPQGSRIALPTAAEDLDSSYFGNLNYNFSSNCSSIKLVVGSGFATEGELYLTVTQMLDREENVVYYMQVIATDGGYPAKSGFLEIIIFIEDSNDNVPKFDRDMYNVSIQENFPVDRPVLQVHAVDLDEGVNGQVVYGLARSSMLTYGTLFHVNATTGDIYLRQALDYQKAQQYILSIAATDSGPSPIPSYAVVVISVIDVNDNVPTIKVKSHLQVAESQPHGTLIGHISVDDMDSGPNGQVNCGILHSDFQLQQLYPKVYKIITNKIFDREEVENYNLTIQCQDNGEPQLTAAQQIYVRIADVNDNVPVFTQDIYSVNVKENNTLNVPIMRIIARDDDASENAIIDYSLSANSAGLLTIDAATGIVSTAGIFDYEEQTRYEFIATATDRGHPDSKSAMATIILNVVDSNDEAPIFLQVSYSFGTYENQPPGTEIGSVAAFDRDTPPYDRFTFSVVASKPAADIFQVDSNSGKIVSVKVLDREQYPVHFLVLAATNIAYPNPSSFVNVTISIADRNDNAPMIDFPNTDNHTLELSGDATIGSFITKIVARDADIGQNARLEYTIAKGNDKDLFELDPVSGVLTLRKHIPLFQAVTTYSLVLMVRDFGEPEKSASAELDISVNRSVTDTWTKVPVGHSSRSFNSSIDAIFSSEVIIVLSSVMAALIVILIITIIYIRRRNSVVYDRNVTSLSKASSRSPSTPKYLVRKPEVCNNEYTYCAAESVDAKDEITSALRLHSDECKYELPDNRERPPTHYTFAKVNNDKAAARQGNLAQEALLSDGHCSPSKLASYSSPIKASNSRSATDTGDIEFNRLLEVLRSGENDSCDCLSHCSTLSNLDSGRGPSETDIQHFHNSHAVVQVTPLMKKRTDE